MSDPIKQAHDGDDIRELLRVLMHIVEIARRLPPGAERVAALEQIRDFQTQLDAILLEPVERSLESEMEYRGVEYRVRRALSSDGWKWSVKFGDREKSGTFPVRDGAVRLAQRFIDELIGDRAPPPLE